MTLTQGGYFWLALTAVTGVLVPCVLALTVVRIFRWAFNR
jgi:hypothetical protein